MKAEHKAVIERARLHDVPPSELAHELLVHDLTNAALFELRNIKAPFHKLNEGQQQEVIDRITEKAKEATATAISIISSRGSITVPLTVKAVKVEEKRSTLTAFADAKEPNCASINSYAGKLCLLVMVPNDYEEGLDFIKPDRDQHDLPLHVSEVTGSLFDHAVSGEDLAGYDDTLSDGEDPLYKAAVVFVMETRRPSISAIQRKLKIGYNRAARILEGMEQVGIVSAPDTHGAREVLRPVLTSTPVGDDQNQAGTDSPLADQVLEQVRSIATKEFGDLDYNEASQIVVLHGQNVTNAWLQRRLGINEDQATTLLLRLADDEVIRLDQEGAASIDNTYKVTKTLEELVTG